MAESALPILILLCFMGGAVAVVLATLRRPAAAWPITMVAIAAAFGFSLRLLATVLDGGAVRHRLGGWAAPIGIELVVDGLGAFVICVVTGIALLVGCYARWAVRREIPERESTFFAMVLVLLLGLSGIVLTGDLFNLYVFFEISSLAAYALIAVGDKRAVVASFRYLVLGTLGASFYLLGIGFLYTLTGTLNMADAATLLPELAANPTLRVSVAMIVTGVGLKMAIFPMQGWLADAYTHASTTTTAIVAPIMTKVSAYTLIRVLGFVYGFDLASGRLPIGTALAWLSAAGIVVGSVMALAQTDVKRMLAYSSVAQVSYIGLGIGLAQPWALVGAVLHVLNHATMKCCLFLVTGTVQLATGGRTLDDYAGLGRRMPWTFGAFTLAALAMIGIPPTGGFFSKWYLTVGALEAGAGGLVVVLVGSGLLTAGYMFRLLERVWARPAPEMVMRPVGAAAIAPIVVLGIAVVVFGVINTWFVTRVIMPSLPGGMGGGVG